MKCITERYYPNSTPYTSYMKYVKEELAYAVNAFYIINDHVLCDAHFKRNLSLKNLIKHVEGGVDSSEVKEYFSCDVDIYKLLYYRQELLTGVIEDDCPSNTVKTYRERRCSMLL